MSHPVPGLPPDVVTDTGEIVAAEYAPVAENCACCGGDLRTVCDACGEHACWAGRFMCEDAQTAGTRTVGAAASSAHRP